MVLLRRRWVWGWLALPGLLLAMGLGLVLHRPDMLPWAGDLDIGRRALAPSSLILDANGRLLYELIDPHTGSHRPVTLEEIPLALRQAIIATEDASFYRNPGVDGWAILRALWTNLRGGEILSGASTITQQLARNLLMEAPERQERTWQRKLREAWLAYRLTRTLSKDEILALYLNETYFGNLAYGVEAAARTYFGKPVSQLDLAECALLAGLPQSPADYNPFTNLSAARARQGVVLELMAKAGYITAQQAALAKEEPLRFAAAPVVMEAPHFCLAVREEAAKLVGEETLRAGGLRIYTTLDLDLQHLAEEQVRLHLERLNTPQKGFPGHNVRNAAVVALDPRDGAVRALVGSPDYFDATISGAVNAALALRQPGSAVKPLTYAAAFERGFGPATMLADVRSSFLTREGTPYVPLNYDYRFHGPVLLRQALACSYNVVAVKLLDRIGLEALVEMARRLGITSWDNPERFGLALTLGGGEVSLWQLTGAYAAFANGGRRVAPYDIMRIEDGQGNILYQAEPRSQQVLDPRIAYLITDILADPQARIPAFGEGSALDLPFPAAVKTGTTTEWRDNWTVGYTSELVVGVWVGNADNQPMVRVSGVTGAAPIWNGIMRRAHRGAPAAFARPPGLVEIEVCALSGLLPTSACDHRQKELFLAENVPQEHCTLHRFVVVDALTGALADASCPAERRMARRVTFWPVEALAWAEEEGLPLPPKVDAGRLGLAAPVPSLEASPDGAGSAALRLVSPDPQSVFRLSAAIPAACQQIEVVASCPGELGLEEVTLWVDGQPWQRWSGPPYRVFWPLAPGEHVFWAEGQDAAGTRYRSATVSITVLAPAGEERSSP
jgi:1A family penicillin-binding protein